MTVYYISFIEGNEAIHIKYFFDKDKAIDYVNNSNESLRKSNSPGKFVLHEHHVTND